MLDTNIRLNIWGREFDLEIDYDKFEGENITSIQEDTYIEFIDNAEQIFVDAYSMIKEYCEKKYSSLVTDNFENIFKYVIPKQLYIKRSVTKKRIAGLLCNFKFDMDNGLAVYIEDGKATKVGSQDIIL